MAVKTQESSGNAPAYVPFDTFESFVSGLKKNGVPDRIDRTLMHALSGAVQSHLLASLRFLGLIGTGSEVRQQLRDLVAAHGEEEKWKARLSITMKAAYASIIRDMNVKTATDKQLREQFREKGGVDGDTLEKAVRFFLKGMKSAGVEISPYFGARKPRRPTRNGREKNDSATLREQKSTSAEMPPADEQPALGTIAYPIYFKGKPKGSLVVPEALTEEDIKVIEFMIPMLRAYVGGASEN